MAWLVLGALLTCVLATFRAYGLGWDGQGEAVFGGLAIQPGAGPSSTVERAGALLSYVDDLRPRR